MTLSIGTPKTASAQLADFCASITWPGVPAAVRARTTELVLDLLGVALRGSAETSARVAASLAEDGRQMAGASVIGAGSRSSAAMAALANGVACLFEA